MDTTSYDEKIRSLEKKKQDLLSQLETQAQIYIREAGNFCAAHFQEMVENAVTQQPQLAQSLGLEKLREMKGDLKTLTENCNKIVAGYLDTQAWDHRVALPDGLEDERAYRPGMLSSKGSDLCHNAGSKARSNLRDVWGHIGQILLKYGLAKAGRDDEWEMKSNSLPTYRYAMSTSKEMDTAVKKYSELFRSYVTTHVEILGVETEKQQAIAKDLWNQA
jgi:hypothetical protein